MSSTRLVAETREIDPVEDLLPFTDPADPVAWIRRGDGIVAAGAPLRVLRATTGTESIRARRLATDWQELVTTAKVTDPVRLPGSGLVAFGALTFDEESVEDSVLIVPSLVLGRHHGRSWITRVRFDDGDSPTEATETPYGAHWSGTLGPGAQDAVGYQASVVQALAAIESGELSKVVVARDLTGTLPADADLRRLVRELSTGYPDTWAFAVDGFIGASPETLVTVQDSTVTARVLAGTIGRGADPDADTAASAALATSAKDLDEHQYAVRSLLQTLSPFARAMASSDQPFLLKLPNLFHLATDVEAELADGATALDLVGALHPTAAVAGTPTARAIAAIRELEPFDRGRYAGPVGWIDANGNGEWAVALRCAQVGPFTADSPTRDVTAFAGAGIVRGSDPERELLETRVKFRPLVDALG